MPAPVETIPVRAERRKAMELRLSISIVMVNNLMLYQNERSPAEVQTLVMDEGGRQR